MTVDDSNWFNVLDYGATGDGVTDDTLAIQRTIDIAAESNCYGPLIIFFPLGTYRIGGAKQDVDDDDDG